MAEEAFERVAARVRQLLCDYEPPDFAHVPDADAAIFLCAVDHKTGYRQAHVVDGERLEGSALMWAVALRAARDDLGLLTAATMRDVDAARVAAMFDVGGETVADPGRRSALWRDLAAALWRDYDGHAATLLDAAKARLGGDDGLLARLAEFDAYRDPLAKKSQLFAKICDRRGWFSVDDAEHWEVSADNVLMRLALRSGLVAPGELDEVRAATRDVFKRLANGVGVEPPLLDDLLWERGRDDPDLLGSSAGDLREPPRDERVSWY